MQLINSNSTLKKLVACLILFLTLSCSKDGNNSEHELENLLYDFHKKNSQTHKLENGIDLLISKDFNKNYKGIFYKIENTDEFYFSCIVDDVNILKVTQLKGKEFVPTFDKNQCFGLFDKTKKSVIPKTDDDCFKIFLGEIPYSGYSAIELEWNCSTESITTEKLIDSKYFFFLKEGLGDDICNIKLIREDGKKEKISYDSKNGSFKKIVSTSITTK